MTAMITPSPGIHAEGGRKAQILMGCDTLESTLSYFLQDLGFRVDAIYPVDNPSTAMISGHGLSIRLVRGASQGVSTIYLLCDAPTKVTDGATVLRTPNVVTTNLAMADSPMIRHRVLENSVQAEVIEIGTPAEHITMANYTMTLPNAVLEPQGDFNGQHFS